MHDDTNDNILPVLEKMRTLRMQKGITQNQVAEGLNVSPAYISNVETAKTRLNVRVLRFYAALLNVSVDYLLNTESDMEAIDCEIISALKGFSTEQKKQLLLFLQSLSEHFPAEM
ncbi:MAG: helix-turn-helix domain-containing protein [Lachnospiraceae bacterium]